MKITPDIVLKAYATGVFPMSDGRDDLKIFWVDPENRGILPLDNFHLPRRMHRIVRTDQFQIRTDTAFAEVMDACAAPASGRWTTWINHEIQELFLDLHERGFAHCVETWANDELAGGLYGIALGGAFFGESMFAVTRDASKVGLAGLVSQLLQLEFRLIDCQLPSTHLFSLGAQSIPRMEFVEELQLCINSKQMSIPWELAIHAGDLA